MTVRQKAWTVGRTEIRQLGTVPVDVVDVGGLSPWTFHANLRASGAIVPAPAK